MIESIINELPCGILAFGDDGKFIDANDSFYSQLGYEKQELEAAPIEKIFTFPTRIFFQTHLFPLIRLKETVEEIFVTLLTKSGSEIPVLLNAKRIKRDNALINIITFFQVPNRKRFEDELVKARAEAQTSLKENTELVKANVKIEKFARELDDQLWMVKRQNQELKQFNHAVTHSLTEPIRKVLIFSDMIRERSANDQRRADLDKLNSSAAHLKNIISGLQQYIWLDTIKSQFEPVDLSMVLQEAENELEKLYQQKIWSVQTRSLPQISADREQMKILLYQLLHNAIKFRKSDPAEIRMNATLLKKNKYRQLENRYLYEDFLKLEILDNGKGFEPKDREHMFDIFRKSHYNEGLGIGLALSKKIVANHGGEIEAEGETGKFARFTIWLPVKQMV